MYTVTPRQLPLETGEHIIDHMTMNNRASWAKATEFLIDFHNSKPGCTSDTFRDCLDSHGQSSYARLAQHVSVGQRVIDLGCGDGYLLAQLVNHGHSAAQLTGVDISFEELKFAQSRRVLTEAQLYLHNALTIPLEDGSFDVVLSHLAFMFFNPLEGALKEVARILKPGGDFIGVLGGGPATTDRPNAVDLFLDCLRNQSPSGALFPPPLTDSRLRKPRGFSSLIESVGDFEDVSMDRQLVRRITSVDLAWAMMTNQYEAYRLPPENLKALKNDFLKRCQENFDDINAIECAFAMHHFRIRRTASSGE